MANTKSINYVRWLIAVQVFRVVGVLFLVELQRGNLPAAFAIPAGIGDILVGITAPIVAFSLRRSGCFGMGCGPDLERSRLSRPCLRCVCRIVSWVNIHSDILPLHNTCAVCAPRSSSPPRNNRFLGTRNSTAIPDRLEANIIRDSFVREFNSIT